MLYKYICKNISLYTINIVKQKNVNSFAYIYNTYKLRIIYGVSQALVINLKK